MPELSSRGDPGWEHRRREMQRRASDPAVVGVPPKRTVEELDDSERALAASLDKLWNVARWVTCAFLLLGIVTPFIGIGAYHYSEFSGYYEIEDATNYHSIVSTLWGRPLQEDDLTMTTTGRITYLLVVSAVLLLVAAVLKVRLFANTGLRRAVVAFSVVVVVAAWRVAPIRYDDEHRIPDEILRAHSYGLSLLVVGVVAAVAVITQQPTDD